ncbi:MAG: GreA/GreB family elongation factor [Bacteroidales bacterium]|nr:GreA/GreB family elongation factor [Bacteroidales bacterium]
MSRGFVKEGDQEETPMVPPRAFLPAGVVNYVTPTGMELLMQERQDLLDERDAIATGGQESDARVQRNFINAKLELLENRIKIAKVMQPTGKKDEIAFGSIVSIRMNGEEMTLQITGVDEANAAKGKIPFTSPMAKGLFGHHIGDIFDIKIPTGLKTIKVLDIK